MKKELIALVASAPLIFAGCNGTYISGTREFINDLYNLPKYFAMYKSKNDKGKTNALDSASFKLLTLEGKTNEYHFNLEKK